MVKFGLTKSDKKDKAQAALDAKCRREKAQQVEILDDDDTELAAMDEDDEGFTTVAALAVGPSTDLPVPTAATSGCTQEAAAELLATAAAELAGAEL